MFNMGFLPDVRRISRHLPMNRQTLLFSATMSPEIRRLTEDVLQDPAMVQVGITVPAETVSHALYPVGQHLKPDLLLRLLGITDIESVLVFTRTKHRQEPGKKTCRRWIQRGFATGRPFSVTPPSSTGRLSQRNFSDPGGHRYRRPRYRRYPDFSCYQLRYPIHPRGIYSPHWTDRTGGSYR